VKKRKKKRRPSRVVPAAECAEDGDRAQAPPIAAKPQQQPGVNGHTHLAVAAARDTAPAATPPAAQQSGSIVPSEQPRPATMDTGPPAPDATQLSPTASQPQLAQEPEKPAAGAASQPTGGQQRQQPQRSVQQQQQQPPCQEAAKAADRQQEAHREEAEPAPVQPSAEELAQRQQEAAREAMDAAVTQATNVLDVGAAAGLDTLASILGMQIARNCLPAEAQPIT
jgi:hypothetical protein